MTDKEKAIRWFENIANECDKLTSGNVAHLKAQIKGMAIRSAEYLKKQEPTSKLTWQDIQRILDISDKLAMDYSSEKLNEIGYEDFCKEVLARYLSNRRNLKERTS